MKRFFILFVLAGILAACQPDALDTALAINGAKVNVTVSVVDTNGDPFSGYTLSATSSSGLIPIVSGNIITLEAAYGSPMAKTDLFISALNVPGFEEERFETIVLVPEILAGGIVDLKARIVVYPCQ